MAKLVLLLTLAVGAYFWWQRNKRRFVPMAPTEARALLGLRDDANLAEIREAHRRLIARVHPDTGGSAELATRVNAARDTLVRELNRR
jgi:hypothetical protein